MSTGVEVGLGKSDEELVRGVIEGRQEDFAVLFERYRADVLRHLRRIHRHDEDAADVTQEVFLRLWHRAGQWKGDGPLLAWLLRIATTSPLNHIRSVRRRREQPLQLPPPWRERRRRTAGSGVDDRRLHPSAPTRSWPWPSAGGCCAALVTRLSEDGRRGHPADLRRPHEHAPGRCRAGIPEGTVKSRIHHARKQIARSWRDLGIDWEED